MIHVQLLLDHSSSIFPADIIVMIEAVPKAMNRLSKNSCVRANEVSIGVPKLIKKFPLSLAYDFLQFQFPDIFHWRL